MSTKLKILRKVLEKNENQAEINRKIFEEKKILAINIMGTPGAGKTTFIYWAIKELAKRFKAGVIEGDYEGSVDAERLAELKVPVVQLNVNSCHLNANFLYEGIKNLPLDDIDVILIENVGNLICPASFDLGEGLRITLYSVPEGDDKPIKYPVMFKKTDVVIITKYDMISHFDFDFEKVKKELIKLNPNIKIFTFSSKTSFPKDLNEFLIDSVFKHKGGNI